MPTDFVLTDLRGTATGYVAVGATQAGATQASAATFWSADARDWVPRSLPQALESRVIPVATSPSSTVTRLVAARDGLIAVGSVLATPGAELWWQSADGLDWNPLPGYGPLGPTSCTGAGCGNQASGTVAGDGQRMLAVRGGTDAGAWTSSDGLTWQQLVVSGDLPAEAATLATEPVVLPAGLLVSNGTTTWFGAAQVR